MLVVAAEQGLVLQLEVLGQRQDEGLGARTGHLVVEVDDVRLDRDRRERGGIDLVRDPVQDLGGRRRRSERPAGRRPAATIAHPDRRARPPR